ncbi:unnamed protein product [Timema podura]|uniref:Uncharacterized protein n=1 Tax=Timema podura TaxID=61482 RepID=A0ABN7NHJ1_TIMPD|nr:unnamed protein product [Timema podura]
MFDNSLFPMLAKSWVTVGKQLENSWRTVGKQLGNEHVGAKQWRTHPSEPWSNPLSTVGGLSSMELEVSACPCNSSHGAILTRQCSRGMEEVGHSIHQVNGLDIEKENKCQDVTIRNPSPSPGPVRPSPVQILNGVFPDLQVRINPIEN